MPTPSKITASDSLESGFRNKTNQAIDCLIDLSQNERINKQIVIKNFDGTLLGYIDLSDFALNAEIDNNTGGNDSGSPVSATIEAEGAVRLATRDEAVAGIEENAVMTPETTRLAISYYVDGDPEDITRLRGLNRAINEDPTATLPATFADGATIVGYKAVDGKQVPITFEQLMQAPEAGNYELMLVETESNAKFRMSFAEVFERMTGGILPTAPTDPGPPVPPVYGALTYSSGAAVSVSFPQFTKADGSAYSYPLTYRMSGLVDQLSALTFGQQNRTLTGTLGTSATNRTLTIKLIATPTAGRYAGQEYEAAITVNILAAEVTQYPQPTILQISAFSLAQGSTTPLAFQVSYPGGITKTGTWSATGLPSGMGINPATGALTGAPTTPGEYIPTIRFRDSDNQSDDMQFTFTVTANPVNAWLLGAFYQIDVNTGGVDVFLRIASGTTAVIAAFEAIDETIYTGNNVSGSPTGTDTEGAGYWQTAQPATGNAEYNFRAGFYPFSISPKTGGLGAGKSYVVYVKRPGDSSAEDFYFYFNPVQNTPITPLLTEAPEEGTGTNQLAPPAIGPQAVIAGTALNREFNDFTGWQSGETKAFAYTGIPAGVTFAFNSTSGKFVLGGQTSGALETAIGVVATGSLGSFGSFSFVLTSTVAASSVTAIYRKFFPSSGIGVGGVITSYGNVSFEAVVSGNQIVQVQANRSTLPTDNDWYDQTKNSAGRYGFTFGQLTGGEVLTIKFRIKGQTAEIPLTYTVFSPLGNNSTAELLVYPTNVPGNNLTPNQLQRVGQPDPQNPIFTPSLAWVTGFDGAQWLRVTATLATATYSWKVFLNGEPVTGFPIDLPQHTQATIDVMDSNNYDPYASDIAKKAQLILYTGTPSGSTVIQNT